MKKAILFIFLALATAGFAQDYVRLAIKGLDLAQDGHFREAAMKLDQAFSQSNDQYLAAKAVDYYLLSKDTVDAKAIAAKTQGYMQNLLFAKIYAYSGHYKQATEQLAEVLRTKSCLNLYSFLNDSLVSGLQQSPDIKTLEKIPGYGISQALDRIALKTSLGKNLDALEELNNMDSAQNCVYYHILKARTLANLNDQNSALQEYRKAWQLGGDKFDIYKNMADLYAKAGDYANAASYLGKAIKLRPYEIQLLLKLADYQTKSNNPGAAIKTLELYKQYRPSDLVDYKIAETYYLQNDYTNTIKTLNPLLEKNRGDYRLFTLRGKAYYKAGSYKAAYYDLSMSLDLNPAQPQLYDLLGEAAFMIGHKQEGCLYWKNSYQTFGSPVAKDKLDKFCNKK